MKYNVNVGFLIKPGGRRIGGSVSPHGGSYWNLPRISPQLNPGWWCAARTMTSEQERTRKTSHDWNKNDVGRAGSIPFHPNIDAFWFWFDKLCFLVDLFLHAMPCNISLPDSTWNHRLRNSGSKAWDLPIYGLAVLSPYRGQDPTSCAGDGEYGEWCPLNRLRFTKSRSLNSTYTGVHMSTYIKHYKTVYYVYSVHIYIYP